MPGGALNELWQRLGWSAPVETWEEEQDSEGHAVFTCALRVTGGGQDYRGTGRTPTKKAARHAAAKQIMEQLKG